VAGGHIELVGLTKRFTEIAVDSIDLEVSPNNPWVGLADAGGSPQVTGVPVRRESTGYSAASP
jgi:hypothetical protein